MSRSIAILESDYRTLCDHLQSGPKEQAAFLLAGYGQWLGGAKLMVKKVLPVPPEGFHEQAEDRLVIAPYFTNRIIKEAAQNNLTIVVVHTHPGAREYVRYSPTDNRGESELFRAFYNRATDQPHASMVFGNGVVAGRFWTRDGTIQPADKLLVVGSRLDVIPLDGRPLPEGGSELYDRQVRALGQAGQARLAALTVAVVGLGGTGSVTAEQLVRLGIGEIILVDHDRLEDHNVSRVYGSTIDDSQKRISKVEIAVRAARAVGGKTKVTSIQSSILNHHVALDLRRADIIFGCTDTHWSRSLLNSLSYQYYTPVIDMGSRITSDGSRVLAMVGRVSLVQPGGPCLICTGIVDPNQVRAESLPEEERAALAREGYVTGFDIAAPSVISLNTVVSGLAVSRFLNLATGLAGAAPIGSQIMFDGLTLTTKRAQYQPLVTCLYCGNSQLVGSGDAYAMPCLPEADAA